MKRRKSKYDVEPDSELAAMDRAYDRLRQQIYAITKAMKANRRAWLKIRRKLRMRAARKSAKAKVWGPREKPRTYKEHEKLMRKERCKKIKLEKQEPDDFRY